MIIKPLHTKLLGLPTTAPNPPPPTPPPLVAPKFLSLCDFSFTLLLFFFRFYNKLLNTEH